MSLERVFARIVFYAIEVAFKGLAGYLAYCSLNAITGNPTGSLYAGLTLFIVLIIMSWDTPMELAEEAISQSEGEE